MKQSFVAMAICIGVLFAACKAGPETSHATVADQALEPSSPSVRLEQIIQDPDRADNAARDIYRHPQQTLEFFGLAPEQTVVEILPGGGWYAEIIVPYIKATKGRYIAGVFPPGTNERFDALNEDFATRFVNADEPQQVTLTGFGASSGPLGPPASADLLLTFRNVHNWMAGEWAEKAFDDFYHILKPGGILGVVEHRLPATSVQDPRAPTGYVQQDYVIALAQEAGFELVATSEINANDLDSADHPLGVWTLPPRNRRNDREGHLVVTDGAPYEMIGESDRMTLKFIKPLP